MHICGLGSVFWAPALGSSRKEYRTLGIHHPGGYPHSEPLANRAPSGQCLPQKVSAAGRQLLSVSGSSSRAAQAVFQPKFFHRPLCIKLGDRFIDVEIPLFLSFFLFSANKNSCTYTNPQTIHP